MAGQKRAMPVLLWKNPPWALRETRTAVQRHSRTAEAKPVVRTHQSEGQGDSSDLCFAFQRDIVQTRYSRWGRRPSLRCEREGCPPKPRKRRRRAVSSHLHLLRRLSSIRSSPPGPSRAVSCVSACLAVPTIRHRCRQAEQLPYRGRPSRPTISATRRQAYTPSTPCRTGSNTRPRPYTDDRRNRRARSHEGRR